MSRPQIWNIEKEKDREKEKVGRQASERQGEKERQRERKNKRRHFLWEERHEILWRRDASGHQGEIGTLRPNDADGGKNVKKTIGLIRKTTTLHVHHAFLYISVPAFARLRRENA